MADDTEFEPHLGRMRSGGGTRARKYVGRVLAATNLARGGAATLGAGRGAFTGSRIGRGAGVGRVLAARGDTSAFAARRVVIKASIVKLAGKGAAGAAAHLRYLQRDGTTRDGAAGTLYDRESDDADRTAFRARGADDRHQFRFIVSAEDGAEYEDLKPLTRRLMERVEEDLGTRLDWVAVDHFNTGHPHTHIVVRGKDDCGADLVIARDYLTSGMRERACELVDLDLGPRSVRAIEAGLRAEVEQERLTSLDRSLLRDMDDGRMVSTVQRHAFGQALRAGRLAKLSDMGLAEPVGGARWRLAEGLDDTLRRMGERGDIVRTMQRAFARRGVARAAADQAIYDPASAQGRELIGRVVGRGLADEHADRHYLVVDGVDGRSHFVEIGKGAAHESVAEGAVVRIEPLRAGVRAVDRTIVAVAAANGGRYDIDAHLRHDPSATDTFAETHVRRLEAMRRQGGLVTRDAAGQWIIADDHLARVDAHEARLLRDRPVTIDILSTRPLSELSTVDAPTWLDRDLVAKEPIAARDAGFGAELRAAQDRRRQWLTANGLAELDEGGTRYRAGLLATLQRRELLRAAGQLSRELSLGFRETASGDRVEGILRRRVDLVGGRFAMIERSREFTLVPWRPVLERQIGKPVSGVLRGDGVSWTIGRGRQGPTIM
ncbi:relaxase/mobilization nuclease RlxS [Sphingomonas sp. PP-CE-1G-424]|uniref:relaxase/mobilization nuclease RlxS n=1 Tax=Sphingomonas sp. PP-CE-1G-424 TaxID=2135658 RepID=UPI001054DC05|nr:relaxase/mobilization nuclease RlxS [Sphingomonas sp. PP-CE-1G-424]TCP65487.1 type IV secretory pathway VirD2 relaxase [Sphingomonas sp. PP-CE-1G-424]